MAINVEIKARVKDIDAFRDKVEVYCDKFSGLIDHTTTSLIRSFSSALMALTVSFFCFL